jgi:UDP-N-acetylglucosamine acyltransferase
MNYIHPEAKIGKNVEIGHFSSIYEDVEIGDGTWIGPNVTIMAGARIGKNCRIFPGAVISAIPQDLKYGGEHSTTTIGDNTTIRECVTINKGTTDRMDTGVGSNCLLMAYVHIAHDCMVGDNCILANGVQLAGHINVGNFAVIGGLSAVHQFVSIGEHVMISGGSLVRKDVPPFIKAGREPLSYAGINSLGLKRRGFSDSEINKLQDVYRIIYQEDNNITQAVEIIQSSFKKSVHIDNVLNFIKESSRGVIRGF